MENLAIKGHATRGKEAIEILEMFGGNNKTKWNGDDESAMYFINENGNIKSEDCSIMKIFTIEEFLEKYPYKVGDKVQRNGATSCGSIYVIEQMKWEDNQVKYIICDLYWKNCKCTVTSEDLQHYKEETTDKANKAVFDANAQCCDIMNHLIKEETMEENIKEKCDLINFNSHYIFDFADKVELILKDDWEVKNEDGRTYVVRKQPQYPKTYNECWKILDAGEEEVLFDGATASEEFLFDSFIKLKRCRDAYWEIAGDWKPNLDSKQHKFAISNVGNKISFEVYGEYNSILCFPTEEMRDTFYENFKDLIEQCKELL